MKRFLCLLLTTIIVKQVVCQGWDENKYDFSAECSSGQVLYYRITSSSEPYTVAITHPNHSIPLSGQLEIPETVANKNITYSVTSIDDNAFYRVTTLRSVIIPETITSIGKYAFYDCYQIPSIIIPEGATSIGDHAFHNCKGLISINIPEGVKNIGNNVFCNCSELTSISIPNSVVSIGDEAFRDCGLTSIDIPNSVISIGNKAFRDCSQLGAITIPNSVMEIGENAFYGCSKLYSVTFESIKSLCEIKFANGEANPLAWGSLSIKDGIGITKVEKQTQGIRHHYIEITIPDSITNIGDYAFYGCKNLNSVTISNSVLNVGNSAFQECTNLESITIVNGVTSIGDETFRDCESLLSISIPNSVVSIGEKAFLNCRKLAKAEFASPEGLCGMEFASDNANPLFYAEHLYINGVEITEFEIPYSFTSIGNHTFRNCCFLTSIIIPNSITRIGEGAFRGCKGLTSVSIPNSVTSIEANSFAGCSNLTSVEIPSSVASIGNNAFRSCSNLDTIIIPNSVIVINWEAFEGCVNLTIKCETASKPALWDSNWNPDNRPVIWNCNNQDGSKTAVTESAANAVNIYAHGNTIVIENATEEIRVYNAMGKLVGRDVARNVCTIRINNSGVYIVKTGNVVKRVMVN